MVDVIEALEIAAGFNISRTLGIGQPANASSKSIEETRRILLRFLENVDEGASALELREALDEAG